LQIQKWLIVTANPEANKINVFNNGRCSGFNTFIPIGGHTEPKTILGDKLA